MKNLELFKISSEILSEFENQFKKFVDSILVDMPMGLRDIFYYHLGIVGYDKSRRSVGKRIRPLLLLICLNANTKDWRRGLQLAAAVELIHNFSLIHDDIEDNSPLRRGQETVWKKWGLAQAVNSGDAMFAVGIKTAFMATREINYSIRDDVYNRFINTCIALTHGQHLDLTFENIEVIGEDLYFEMISGKTAALLGLAAYCGAALSIDDPKEMDQYYNFGHTLGLAFQVYDDYLGIWGSEEFTGKPVNSDLIEKKQTYPILIGLKNNETFRKTWAQNVISTKDASQLNQLLEEMGAKKATIEKAEEYTENAHGIIRNLNIRDDYRELLREFCDSLISRQY